MLGEGLECPHNPKVVDSNPAPATKKSVRRELGNSTRELGNFTVELRNFTRELGNDWGKLGQRLGSYIRTGDGDHKMSSYEIDRYIENQYRSARNDAAVVEGATMDDLDRELLTGWLSRVRATTLGRSAALSDEELMANRRVVSPDAEGVLRPTVAGIMALGFCPQQFFPRANVVFTAYPTPKKGEVGRAGERFSDSVDIDGPIPVMVVDAVRAASRNMKHGAIVKGALRENVPDYPLAAVREAVANALMHRDYSPDALGTPVMVDLYPDRLELSNPGGLFGSLTVERLGQRGATASRNQFLARILEDVPYSDVDGRVGRVVENRGSGYPTINRELEQALMPAPIAKSTLDEFVLIMRHRRMTDQEGRSYTKENVKTAILGYITDRESASTSELAKASGMSMKTVRRYLSALMEEGIVEGIGMANSPKRRYRHLLRRDDRRGDPSRARPPGRGEPHDHLRGRQAAAERRPRPRERGKRARLALWPALHPRAGRQGPL